MRYSFCYQNSNMLLLRAEDVFSSIDIFMQSKKKAVANSETVVKISGNNVPKYGHDRTFQGPR